MVVLKQSLRVSVCNSPQPPCDVWGMREIPPWAYQALVDARHLASGRRRVVRWVQVMVLCVTLVGVVLLILV